ncbi:tripartite tricarboxylate transporter substrate binding protein [Pseudochelatococcus sp. B33]
MIYRRPHSTIRKKLGGNQMKAHLPLRALVVAAIALGLGPFSTSVLAQEKPSDFPRRPISLVVVYPAGGAVDVTARTVADLNEKHNGTQFRVENRVGGAGIVGHTYIAKQASPDGYTIGVIANPFMFTDVLLRDASFNIDDFDPITTISFDPVVWLVRSGSEIGDKSLPEIIEHAKASTLQVGMNPNSMFLFVSEFLAEQQGVKFNFIPFDGGRQGVTALLAGDIDATAAFYSEVEQFVRNGDLRAVAVTGDERHQGLPDTPTFAELGIPMVGQTWGATRFLALPKGVPEDRKAWLAKEFLATLTGPDAPEAFQTANLRLTPADEAATKASYQQTFDDLRKFLISSGRLAE